MLHAVLFIGELPQHVHAAAHPGTAPDGVQRHPVQVRLPISLHHDRQHHVRCFRRGAADGLGKLALILLVQFDRVDVIIATIIIGREITISSLREWMAQIGAHRSVAVSMVGKVKTAAQMIAIPLLLYKAPIAGMDTLWIGTQLIYVAAVLTLWSMGYYMRMAWPHLSGHDKK